MNALYKHDLEYALAWEFVKGRLDEVSALSDVVLKEHSWTKGSFYTLLPQDAHLECLHQFKEGGILTQNPEEEHYIEGKKSTYSIIPTIREQLSELILKKMSENLSLNCVFDSVNCFPKEMLLIDSLQHDRRLYADEIYLIFDNHSASRDKILKSMELSQAFWHSLCVLTCATLDQHLTRSLSLEQIQAIALNAQVIMVGAYDGEGYVFWEKDRIKY